MRLPDHKELASQHGLGQEEAIVFTTMVAKFLAAVFAPDTVVDQADAEQLIEKTGEMYRQVPQRVKETYYAYLQAFGACLSESEQSLPA